MSSAFVAFTAAASLLAAACASAPPAESPDPNKTIEPEYNDPRRKDVEATKAVGKPRLDLHCTPQAADDESKCAAMGADHHLGPPLICRGVDVGPEIEAEERKVYEAGTNPCTCISSEQVRMCSMVP